MERLLSKKARPAAYGGLSFLMLSALLLMIGCGGPPGPPGSSGPPAMGPPGARPGGPPGALPGGSKSPATSLTQNASVKPVGTSPATTSPVANAPVNDPTKTLPGLPGKPPGLPTPNQQPGNASKNPLGSVSKVEQAGNTVSLASDIIDAQANPFISKLPKPDIPAPSPETAGGVTDPATVAPPVDPFENISLVGIVHHSKNPVALLSVGGGENQSKLVRKGDVLFMDGGQVKVLAIKRDSVEMGEVGGAKQTRTLSLPSIVGYAASSSSGSGSASAGGGSSGAGGMGASDRSGPGSGTSTSPSGSTKSSSGNPDTSDLSNLKKLSSSKKSSSPDVSLQEP